jgi:hypothetical protein
VFPWVTCVVSIMSSDMVHTLSPPLRSEMKTTFFPSGLKTGRMSADGANVTCRTSPPRNDASSDSISIVNRLYVANRGPRE